MLLLGSDSRDPDGAAGGPYRADTIMLMHVPSDRQEAYFISIPRDLWVPIPPTPDGSAGGREAKINAATAFGGVPLMVQTVEAYTGVRLDHVVLVDFGGFVEVTDALGGVEMEIKQTHYVDPPAAADLPGGTQPAHRRRGARLHPAAIPVPRR